MAAIAAGALDRPQPGRRQTEMTTGQRGRESALPVDVSIVMPGHMVGAGQR
jgi:hypothetical protein